jgi:peptide/nickel transport system substrate-binding protein
MYNAKFRQALSVAIDRARINEIAALGLATPRQFSLSPESPEFQTPEGKEVYEAWSTSYAQHDPDQAKAWLDEIGLKDVNGDGFREREDGSPLELIVEVSIGDPQSIDSCDLLKEDWEGVGLKTTISAVDWAVMDQHASVGELMIRAWGSAAAWVSSRQPGVDAGRGRHLLRRRPADRPVLPDRRGRGRRPARRLSPGEAAAGVHQAARHR